MMSNPTLYLFIGAPGAGKTSLAKIIQNATGGVHLWADHERKTLFGTVTHSIEESNRLYEHLNAETERLLGEGQTVIFDTNFNHYADREHLREIAKRKGAKVVLIWVTTPRDLSKERAVGPTAQLRNGYFSLMTDKQFQAITAKLEQPRPDEKVIKIDGTKLDKATVLRQLTLA